MDALSVVIVSRESEPEMQDFTTKLTKILAFYDVSPSFTVGEATGADAVFDRKDEPDTTTFMLRVSLRLLHLVADVPYQLEDGVFKIDSVPVIDVRNAPFYNAFRLEDMRKELRLDRESHLIDCLTVLTSMPRKRYRDVVTAFYEGDHKAMVAALDKHEPTPLRDAMLAYVGELGIAKHEDKTPMAWFESAMALDETGDTRYRYIKYLEKKVLPEHGVALAQRHLETLNEADRLTLEHVKTVLALCEMHRQEKAPQKATPRLETLLERLADRDVQAHRRFHTHEVKAHAMQGDIYLELRAFQAAQNEYSKAMDILGRMAQKHPYGNTFVDLFEKTFQRFQHIQMRSIEAFN